MRTLGGVLHPAVVDDHDVRRVPVAVLIHPVIETPGVIVDRHLRELYVLGVRRDTDTPRFYLSQFPGRLHLPSGQVTFLWVGRRHRGHLAVANIGRNGGLARLVDLVSTILLDLTAEKAMAILMVLVFSESCARNGENGGRDEQVNDSSTAEHEHPPLRFNQCTSVRQGSLATTALAGMSVASAAQDQPASECESAC